MKLPPSTMVLPTLVIVSTVPVLTFGVPDFGMVVTTWLCGDPTAEAAGWRLATRTDETSNTPSARNRDTEFPPN